MGVRRRRLGAIRAAAPGLACGRRRIIGSGPGAPGPLRWRRTMKILMAYDATAEGRAGLLTTPELVWLPHEQMHLLAVMPMPSGLFLGEGYVPGEIQEEDRARAQA